MFSIPFARCGNNETAHEAHPMGVSDLIGCLGITAAQIETRRIFYACAELMRNYALLPERPPETILLRIHPAALNVLSKELIAAGGVSDASTIEATIYKLSGVPVEVDPTLQSFSWKLVFAEGGFSQ